MKNSHLLSTKRRYLNFLIAFETSLILVLTGLAVQLRNHGDILNFRSGAKEYILLVAFPFIWLISLSLFGAWDLRILENHIDGYRLLMGASTLTFLAFCSASYIFKVQLSRFVILFSLVGGTLLHLLLRWIFLKFADKKLKDENKITNWLILSNDGYLNEEVNALASQHQATCHILSCEFSDFASWINRIIFKIEMEKITRVLLPQVAILNPSQIQQLMWSLHQIDAEFIVFDNLGLATSQSRRQYFDGLSWVAIGEPRINESLRVVKRLFDLVLVVPAIILLIPIFLSIAILIKLDSPGKILYVKKRIGQNGKLISFPKFRSMKEGSDNERLSVLGRPDQNMTDRYQNDPRITRVGRYLRRYSLDELPQFWCVLVGTMSLVGPRPILPEEEVQMSDFHVRRQVAKPGLTGIWQVSGRKETSWDDRMAFDIKYVEEWSIALDLILLARTVKVVLTGNGAY